MPADGLGRYYYETARAVWDKLEFDWEMHEQRKKERKNASTMASTPTMTPESESETSASVPEDLALSPSNVEDMEGHGDKS